MREKTRCCDARGGDGSFLRGRLVLPTMLTCFAFGLVCGPVSAVAQTYIVTDLGTLPGGSYSVATAMNDAGQVVGYGNIASGEQHAFLWDAAHGMRDLGTLGGTYSQAFQIDNAGHVGGYAGDANDDSQPFIYFDANNNGQVDSGEMQEGTLPTRTFPDPCTFIDESICFAAGVTDSNAFGDVVGWYCPTYSCPGSYHPFLYSGSVLFDLGTFGYDTQAVGINNLGQVVGNGCTSSFGGCSGRKSFLYSNGTFTDLSSLIPEDSGLGTTIVSDINNQGQIAGYGNFNGGSYHAFLLSVFRLVDAQGFQPQLSDGVATLQTPVTTVVDSSFVRVGSLTDGASLIVVQLAPEANPAGWTVTLTDPNNATNGAAALGSLWHGDETTLPSLPATLTNAGTITITLGANETAVFYRAAPSWAFGSGKTTNDIQIQIFDQSTNLAAASTFTLHKPPLVLVHGGVGDPTRWDNFAGILTNVGIVVDSSTRADYASNGHNFSGLDVIYTAVPIAISNKIAELRSQDKVAATRLDVVAHSAGGLATRWYMTPSSDRQTGDRVDQGVATFISGVFPLRFKTLQIHDDAQMEFRRPDNFGVGDIRRLITLGTPYRGMTVWAPTIKFLNRAMQHKLERKREEGMTGISWLEVKWKFQFIPIEESQNPTNDQGMMILDLAAFGLDGEGPVSRVLDALPPVPVPYAPIEGVALDSFLDGDDLLAVLYRFYTRFATGGLPPPPDTLLSNSDGVVPGPSARNLNPIVSSLRLEGINHIQLGNHRFDTAQGQLMELLLGPDEDLYYQP